MIGYASRTGTIRNLEALRAAGWGLLVPASGDHRAEGFSPYALDSGAWAYHGQGVPFDVGSFEKLVGSLGEGAEFIVLPDIVGGGQASLKLSMEWLSRLEGVGRRRLIAVQDGMSPWDVEPLLGPTVGIFVGGSTAGPQVRGMSSGVPGPTWTAEDPRGGWKWRSLPFWGHLARRTGCYLHVGRVNSSRRILECSRVGADSFDGTSVTKWAKNITKLDASLRQGALLQDRREDR